MRSEQSIAAFNAKYGGKLALTYKQKAGHLFGNVLGVGVLAHRVIWAMETGAWPTKNIDHINGDPADNRLCNLREAAQADNVRNAAMYKNNTSGAVGVYARKDGRFNAYVRVDGRAKHLGCYATLLEAKLVSQEARVELGFSPRHGV